ncbi:MAG TPA: DUF3224 domain-containing protein [Bacteroidota bacterium]|nr:DUF3224 domain-containing protein [Bacteroidota bacterium]
MKATASYKVNTWEEQPYEEISPGMKLTRASVEYGFTGDLEGKGKVEYLMFYSRFDAANPHNATASYLGLIRFTGALAGKTGSFVLTDNGAFQAGTARSRLLIADDSGTGDLRGISGTGMYVADKDGFRLELDYRLS